MRLIASSSAADVSMLVPLTQRWDDPSWETRAEQLADVELAEAIDPPTDAELLRFHPALGLEYELRVQGTNTTTPASADLTRLGFTNAELAAGHAGFTQSLYVLSYYVDPEGTRLLSRNHLRLGSMWGHIPPVLPTQPWRTMFQAYYRQPSLEHGVVYAPADTTRCWLQIRLLLARGGRQITFTTDATGSRPGLLPLVLDPETLRYQPEVSVVYELVPVRSRRREAPVLNEEPRPTPRYSREAGGLFNPLQVNPDYQAPAPTSI